MFKVYSAKIGQILLVILFLSYIGCKKSLKSKPNRIMSNSTHELVKSHWVYQDIKWTAIFRLFPNSANGILEASCSAGDQDSVAFEDSTSANVQAQGAGSVSQSKN